MHFFPAHMPTPFRPNIQHTSTGRPAFSGQYQLFLSCPDPPTLTQKTRQKLTSGRGIYRTTVPESAFPLVDEEYNTAPRPPTDPLKAAPTFPSPAHPSIKHRFHDPTIQKAILSLYLLVSSAPTHSTSIQKRSQPPLLFHLCPYRVTGQ